VTTADLIRRAVNVNQAMLALGNEMFEADGALFVRNRDYPDIRDANHVAHVTAATPDEIDRLLARVEREFAGIPHRQFHADFETPPAFEARLALDGHQRQDLLVMLLEGGLQGEAKPHDIRLIEDEAGWAEYEALHKIDWASGAEGLEAVGYSQAVGDAMFHTRRAKSPPARFWLAYVDGRPVAYVCSWEGPDGVGIVDDLFTHEQYRHRGLATSLIHRGVADARSRGAGPVVIVAGPDDTPKQMYAAMGFRPVAIKREYWRQA
jgi:GNAT superfamily N-acetyltransferase